MTAIPITSITVNDDRRALDAEKVTGLAASIAEIGLLNPITINADYSLIAGLHRLEAHKQLGLAYIEANILNLDPVDAELAEIDENLIRNELTVLARSELLVRRKAVYEKKHPESCKPLGGRPQKNAEIISTFADDTAAKTGVTARTIRQEVQIAEDIADDVREALSKTDVADRKTDLLKLAKQDEEDQREIASLIIEGEAKTVPQAIKIIRDAEKIERQLPEGTYQVIYADPPWRYDNSGFDEAADNQYPTMKLEDICALPVAHLAADTSVLFIWATNPLLPEALQVMSSWGFTYKTNMAWIKDKGRGKGWYLRSKHELLLIGVREQTPPPIERPDSCFEAERGPIHSRKPIMAYEIIESMYPGNKIELFSRTTRDGWDAWGNEVM